MAVQNDTTLTDIRARARKHGFTVQQTDGDFPFQLVGPKVTAEALAELVDQIDPDRLEEARRPLDAHQFEALQEPTDGRDDAGARPSFLTVPGRPEQTLENCQRIIQLLQHVDYSGDGVSETAEMGQLLLLQELDSAIAGLPAFDRLDGGAA